MSCRVIPSVGCVLKFHLPPRPFPSKTSTYNLTKTPYHEQDQRMNVCGGACKITHQTCVVHIINFSLLVLCLCYFPKLPRLVMNMVHSIMLTGGVSYSSNHPPSHHSSSPQPPHFSFSPPTFTAAISGPSNIGKTPTCRFPCLRVLCHWSHVISAMLLVVVSHDMLSPAICIASKLYIT